MPIFRELCSLPLAAVATLFGVSAFQQLGDLPDPLWGWLFLPLVALVWRYTRLLPIAIAALGFLWAWLYAATILSMYLPAESEGRDLIVEGTIVSVPKLEERRAQFEFKTTNLFQDGMPLPNPGRILLNWYYPEADLRVGDSWRLQVRLKRPHGLSNPGSFDYEAWLFRHRLRATGYVRDSPGNRLLASRAGDESVGRMRQALAQAITGALPQHDYAGIIQALAIGERAGISAEQWRVWTATGTNHLMAISGLHVGMVAGMAFFLVRALWARVPRLPLYWPAAKAGAAAGIMAAVLYAVLAGFSVPTQRTVIMLVVVMGSLMLGRNTRHGHILALALLLVLLWDPLAVLEAGFWLSFAAVAIIFYGMGQRLTPRSLWWKWGRVHVLIAIGLAPLLLILFQRISIVSPLANLIAVPWVTLVVVPLTLLGTMLILPLPSLGTFLLVLADGALGWLWPFLERLAHSDMAQWFQPAPPLWAYLPALLGSVWLLAPAGVPGRWLGGVLLAPMLLANPARPASGEAWFTLLDVGQGLAAVVQTAEHVLVFDAGPATGERFDTGNAVVVPFLRHYGIRRVDTLIASHGDMDHRGGVPAVLAQTEVKRLLTSVPDKILWEQGKVESCVAGQAWQWDGVRFEILYPMRDQPYRGNDASCVLRVQTGKEALLLTGDIEKRSEALLLEQEGDQLPADILVAPHHGSNTSSTEGFLRATQPRYVLFPVGYRNRYGFPRRPVVERYEAQGTTLLDSAHYGAISFHLDALPGMAPPETYRQAARRYWNSP
jgi:competence protein ComEC